MSRINSRRSLHALLCGISLVAIASCSSLPQGPQPVQSPNDDYRYRLLTLDNQLQVLLISDPGAPKAAAALDVRIGSGDNPKGRAGMAHFLEHMLFLGTDKYPDSGEYQQFIAEHGGSHNAYTSFGNTNYFFDINADYLPEALDRFAQFFIAPRFDVAYVDREKNAVEAEYQMGLKSDQRRELDVLQEVMNPEHPYSQFSVGTLETLADRPDATIRDDMVAFYNSHYSSNIMRLAVLGSESLDELEALVRPLYSRIANRDLPREAIEAPLIEPARLPLMVELQPLATQRTMTVSFPIPDYRDEYRVKPGIYVGNLIGHEGEGSLFSRLKEEGLAESLGAGEGFAWDGGALFSLGLTLTEQGAAQPERILQLVFAYTDMLRKEGPQEWMYREQSRLAELSFRFREQSSPMGYVSALASGMQYYKASDILRGPYMMEDYEAAMLAELLEYIRPENALVMFSDQAVEGDEVSQYYQVPYSQKPLAPMPAPVEADVLGTMRLPAPNEFIAENVALVALPETLPAIPVVAFEAERQRIWYMPDAEFRVPRGVTYINFRSPAVGVSAAQAAHVALYTALLTDRLNEFAYPAQLAGMSFSFSKNAEGISLRLGGYTDKQQLLLQRLLEQAQATDYSAQRFDNIRKDMIRTLENRVAKRPSSQVVNDLNEALKYNSWGEEVLIEALQGTKLADLDAYIAGFWQEASAEALIFGNYPEARVAEVSALLDVVLGAGPAPALPPRRILKLAAGESIQFPVSIPHDDAVVAWYLQGNDDQWNDRAMTALTAQIISSGFFDQLRTEQQLGYVVGAYNYPLEQVPGLVLLVQSPSADAAAVAVAMQAYMTGVTPLLELEQFTRHKAALISDILRPDKNLAERAEHYWRSIARKEYDFAGRETLVAAVEAITLQDWAAYYADVFIAQPHALQVVAPGRQGKLPEGRFEVVESAAAIKRDHATYLVD